MWFCCFSFASDSANDDWQPQIDPLDQSCTCMIDFLTGTSLLIWPTKCDVNRCHRDASSLSPPTHVPIMAAVSRVHTVYRPVVQYSCFMALVDGVSGYADLRLVRTDCEAETATGEKFRRSWSGSQVWIFWTQRHVNRKTGLEQWWIIQQPGTSSGFLLVWLDYRRKCLVWFCGTQSGGNDDIRLFFIPRAANLWWFCLLIPVYQCHPEVKELK
jgi:hypothetical protein